MRKLERCHICYRTITRADWARGIIITRNMGLDDKRYEHRRPCEGVPLRVLRTEATKP